MKLLLFNCIVVLSHIGQAQTLRYEGILNDTSIDPDFDKGHEAISTSIKENLAHLNLYEYAHALPELYPLVENGVIEAQQWKYFVDSLELEVIKHQNGSIVPYWAVDYTGLIPYSESIFYCDNRQEYKIE